MRVSPLLLVARALLLAVRRHPMINSAWDEASQEIVVKDYVNLGIAAATAARPDRAEHQGRGTRSACRELADALNELTADRPGRQDHPGRT